MKGETIEEITGFARAMRVRALHIEVTRAANVSLILVELAETGKHIQYFDRRGFCSGRRRVDCG